MLEKKGSKLLHWNYFLALESDLDHVSRYIEFTEDNNSTYSLELAHLLLATGSEVDVVLKSLCNKVQPKKIAKNIDDYRKTLVQKFPRISEFNIRIPRHNLNIKPWENWKEDKNPNWWKAYNNVKHERNKHFQDAKLQFVIAAVAGLLVANLYLYKDEAANGQLVPLPKLLAPPQDCIRGLKQSDFGITLVYEVP